MPRTTTTLVAYQGNVYHWECVFSARGRRMAEISPVGGGTVIAAPVCKLRRIPGPGLTPTYSYAGSAW